jgi:hypothetical protein
MFTGWTANVHVAPRGAHRGNGCVYDERVTGPVRDLRTDIAHPARVYDYWLRRQGQFRGRSRGLGGGEPGYNADRAWAYGGIASL